MRKSLDLIYEYYKLTSSSFMTNHFYKNPCGDFSYLKHVNLCSVTVFMRKYVECTCMHLIVPKFIQLDSFFKR